MPLPDAKPGFDDLIQAVKSRDPAQVRAVLEADSRLILARPEGKVTPLMLAAYLGSNPVVELLLAKGATLDIFEAAILGSSARVVRLVMNDRIVLEQHSPDGWTALHLAVHFGRVEATEVLVDFGADVNARSKNENRNMPLHAAAAGRGGPVVDMLLRKGAEPNAQDAGGNTPLHIAAAAGNVEVARRLLAAGARTDIKSNEGKTALDIARERKSTVVEALLGEHVAA